MADRHRSRSESTDSHFHHDERTSQQEHSSLWSRVVHDLGRLDAVKRIEDELIDDVNKIHEEIIANEKGVEGLTTANGEKLSKLYKESIAKCVEEQKCLASTLKNLSTLIEKKKALESGTDSARHSPELAKRKKRKGDEKESHSPVLKKARSSLSKGSSEAPALQKGQAVAALTSTKNNETGQEWILARVLQFFPERNKYLIQDDEPDDEGVKAQYTLSRRHVLPLPPAAVATGTADWPELPIHSEVLALYPGTSCFYKATVLAPPSKVRNIYSLPTYVVTFEEDAGQELAVEAQLVIECPKERKKQ